jgi:phytoene/squalene synthetase
MDYCRYSAMPVGRFVLDVHGEPKTAWGPSDALCTALQIINHLQDCAKDYKSLDRVYIPFEDLARHGLDVTALAQAKASPQLLSCLHALASRTARLIPEASQLPRKVMDLRLSVETSVIVELARRLLARLESRDPLVDCVHFSKPYAVLIAVYGAARALTGRAMNASRVYHVVKDDAA